MQVSLLKAVNLLLHCWTIKVILEVCSGMWVCLSRNGLLHLVICVSTLMAINILSWADIIHFPALNVITYISKNVDDPQKGSHTANL